MLGNRHGHTNGHGKSTIRTATYDAGRLLFVSFIHSPLTMSYQHLLPSSITNDRLSSLSLCCSSLLLPSKALGKQAIQAE